MDETTVLTTLLQAYDDLEAVTLHEISAYFDGGYLMYRIQQANGTNYVARAYRRDYTLADWFRAFYPWAPTDAAEWLETRAATLVYLEQQQYPAPRVLRTRTGALVGTTPEWCILIQTFVEGTILQPTLDQLRIFGAELGRLHKLSSEQTGHELTAPGKSTWDAEDAFATVQAHLVSVEHRLPEEWKALHAGFSQTLQRLQQGPVLPRTVIHGDAWAANAVQTLMGQVMLIDWETGGWGPAIFDLGRLLYECHLNSDLPHDEPLAWHIQPDPQRIGAVVDGYAGQRKLTELELDYLPDGLRFSIVFIGALHFVQALKEETHSPEWEQGMQRRLARLQNRWEVIAEIAEVARERFELVYHTGNPTGAR